MRNGLLLILCLALTASVWFVLAASPEPGLSPAEEAGVEAVAPRPGTAVPSDAGLRGDELATTRTEEAVLEPESGAEAPSPLPEVLGPAGRVRARIVDGSGRPAAEALLKLTLSGWERPEPGGETADPLAGWRETLEVVPGRDGLVEVRLPAGSGVGIEVGGPQWHRVYRSLQSLRAEETVDLGEIALMPAGQLHGIVQGSDGLALAGAELVLRVPTASQWWGGESWNVRSEADGSYAFDGLPAGHYQLRVTAQQHRQYVDAGLQMPEGGGRVAHDVRLDAGRPLRGVVLDEDRNPVAGAQVWLLRAPDEGWWGDWRPPTPDAEEFPPAATTAPDGSFTVHGWSEDEGLCVLVAGAEAYADGNVDVDPAGGPAVLTLARHLRIGGQVQNAGGDGVAAASVTLHRQNAWGGEPEELEQVEAETDGSFHFTPQPAGAYLLSVDSALGELDAQELTLERDRNDLLLTLAETTELVLAVRNGDGQPVAGATVRVRQRGGMKGDVFLSSELGFSDNLGFMPTGVERRGATDDAGEVRFGGLPAGTLQLFVNADGYARRADDIDRDGGAQRIEVELHLGAGLVVAVTGSSGQPVRDLPVALQRADDGSDVGERATDSAGRAVWKDLEPGGYLVAYRAQDADGYWWRNRDNEETAIDRPLVELPAGEVQLVAVQVADLALATAVVHRHGVPAPGVKARLEKVVEDDDRNMWGDANRGAPTDGRGEAELPPVEIGTYELVVKPSRDAPETRERVELHAGPQRLEIEIDGGSVGGRLLGTSGSLVGARVSLVRALSSVAEEEPQPTTVIGYSQRDGGIRMEMGRLEEQHTTTRSAEDGGFEFRDVPDGDWTVVVRAEGYGSWQSLPVSVRGGNTVRLPDRRMLPGAVIHGRDLAHVAEPGADRNNIHWGDTVNLEDESGQTVAMAQLGADGEYSLEDLPAGTYVVIKAGWRSEPFRVGAGETRRIDIPVPQEKDE